MKDRHGELAAVRRNLPDECRRTEDSTLRFSSPRWWRSQQLVFAIDSRIPAGLGGGVPYSACVVVALWLPWRHSAIAAALACSALNAAALHLSSPPELHWTILASRATGLVAIWAAALAGQHQMNARPCPRGPRRGAHRGALPGERGCSQQEMARREQSDAQLHQREAYLELAIRHRQGGGRAAGSRRPDPRVEPRGGAAPRRFEGRGDGPRLLRALPSAGRHRFGAGNPLANVRERRGRAQRREHGPHPRRRRAGDDLERRLLCGTPRAHPGRHSAWPSTSPNASAPRRSAKSGCTSRS